MIITLKPGTTKKGVEQVIQKVKELGFTPHISKGTERTIIGVIGENPIRTREIFEAMFIVESVTPISKPYKLVSREFKGKDTVVKVKDVKIGGKKVVIIAGPCSVEGREVLVEIAQRVKEAGAGLLRGGAFKPRTSPYSFQGLGKEGLKYLAEASKATGLPVVTEAMDPRQVELVSQYADVIQIGARNMQNFDLLKEVGRSDKPVLLKRGMASTIKELLMSAEYILSRGNENVILCERGIRTFEDATRFTLDLSAVPLIKRLSHLPVIVDPSHGTGKRELI
ncbi:MAG: 3-deoxy-7-phosphoheptulonate synthase, partial [Deltaproteobacteria bacterium]|nr:3-deoxy-7-phosphoheptulonate synthase [Deltaproteobacteria bacterium]